MRGVLSHYFEIFLTIKVTLCYNVLLLFQVICLNLCRLFPKAQIHLALLQNFSHSRMFKKFTKFIVKQMDPSKELVPVESIADNEYFRPLYLLKKKRKSKRIFRRAPYYQWTGFTLDDVLLPGEDGKSIGKAQI